MVVIHKQVTLQRFKHDKVTFGKITLDWLPEHKDIYTIELPWMDNIQNQSCIPQGIYNCSPYSSVKYKNVWQVRNVPNRSNILIHSGNFACDVKLQASVHDSDTQGCILVGMRIDEAVPMVQRSKEAMAYLHEILGADNFSIHVKD